MSAWCRLAQFSKIVSALVATDGVRPSDAVLSAVLTTVDYISRTFDFLQVADVPVSDFEQPSELGPLFRDLITLWGRHYDESAGPYGQWAACVVARCQTGSGESLWPALAGIHPSHLTEVSPDVVAELFERVDRGPRARAARALGRVGISTAFPSFGSSFSGCVGWGTWRVTFGTGTFCRCVRRTSRPF